MNCARIAGVLVLVALSALSAVPATAQRGIPIVDLPPAAVKTSETLGAVLGVRQLSGGMVLVNDAGRRQVRLFDSLFATSTVVLDSTAGTSTSYGRRPAPLLTYVGDSSLFPDYQSRTAIVLDERGRVARSLALPTITDIGLIRRGAAIDDKGRIIFAGNAPRIPASKEGEHQIIADSVPILRADLSLRRTDTVGRIARPEGRTTAVTADGSASIIIWTVDPLRTVDDWAVLSDGSLALVRGHDYHVDWVRSDGATSSSAKMPFDWKRLGEDDKQRIIDSTRAKIDTAIASGLMLDQIDQIEVLRRAPGAGASPPGGASQGGRGERAAGGSSSPFAGMRFLPPEVVSADKIADYYPPLRSGTALADRDGNLWILPTTSTQSRRGELVYDVVNNAGELYKRVRVPLGRLIVGFGPGGTVYMTSGNSTSGYVLERSTLPAATR